MPEKVKLPTNPLYRSIFLRTLSHASSLGADSGECFYALENAGSTITPASWMIAWSELGSRLNLHAASLLETRPPQLYSAKLAYLRASNYHRTAFVHLWGYPLRENAVIPSYNAMRANFASAARLFEPPLISLEIPFQGVTMRGYLANPPDIYRNGRLMVVIGGYHCMEELYFFCSHHAISRGYSVLVFDGPGQGGTLIESGLKVSNNYGEVLSSVLDVAAVYGTWRRKIVMGLSFGGLLCLQAASSSNIAAQVHAVVADPAELNLIDTIRWRIPFAQGVYHQLPESRPLAIWLLEVVLARLAAGDDMAGWTLRGGMLVHGCNTPMQYLKSIHEFDNAPILGRIKTPVLITRAQKDQTGDRAEIVYQKLVNCEKKSFLVFRDEEGTAEHCQTGARMLFSERVFAWLDENLS